MSYRTEAAAAAASPAAAVEATPAESIPVEIVCSEQGFEAILGAITQHFKSYLDIDPEVQCELSLYKTRRDPRATFVEYTTTMTSRLRDLERSLDEQIPPKLKGYIIKRQASLTKEHRKAIHLWHPGWTPTADKVIELLTRLDQPDALVDLVLKERMGAHSRQKGGS